MSTIGSVRVNNGNFIVTNADGSTQQADLGTLLMMLNLKRTESLDGQIADMLSEIKDRNDTISKLTQFMAECRVWKDKKWGDGGQMVIAGKSQTPWQWAKELGIPWTTPGSDGAKWDLNVSNIRGKVDIMNNDSQMANIKLQNLLEKRNNAFDMATQVMKTNNQTVQSTIRNL